MTSRIIIIGNGFDLSHGFKSTYGDFIKYLIEESINYNDEIRNEIINLGYLRSEDSSYENFKSNFEKYRVNSIYWNKLFTNLLFKHLLSHFFEANWVDIEKVYFEILTSEEFSAIEINKDFEFIKKHLEKYLILQEIKFREKDIEIENYRNIFYENNPSKVLFINFNYTSTLNQYVKKSNIKVVNIHGELNSKNNPIIFGYGDDDDSKYKDIINNKDDIYFQNLKRQLYNLSSSYKVIRDFLNFNDNYNIKTDVYTIGHSIGKSDRTLLYEIFENSKVFKIKMFYYKDVNDFKKLNNNMRRIVSDETFNHKVINFPQSQMIPQLIIE